ncbi:MAG: hypothetical protein AAFR17_17950, partial [Pseudomonadota bacterium]
MRHAILICAFLLTAVTARADAIALCKAAKSPEQAVEICSTYLASHRLTPEIQLEILYLRANAYFELG